MSLQNMEEKNKIIQQLKRFLFQEEFILFAYLHGSFLSETKFNDVDIGVYLDSKVTENIKAVDFEISLSLKIENFLKLPVDVKVINFAPLSFRYQVTCGYPLFSRDELKREEFLCKTWKEYFDFMPISRLYLREVMSG